MNHDNGSTLDVPAMEPRTYSVHFGRLSVGTATLRLPFKLSCGAISTQQARETFCERRLDVRITSGDGQKHLPGLEDADGEPCEVEGVGDTKGLSISGGYYKTGLTFNRNDVDQEALVMLVERDGRLEIHQVSEIPAPERKPKAGHPDVEAGMDRPVGTPALEAAARLFDAGGNMPLSALADFGLTASKVSAIVSACPHDDKGQFQIRHLEQWIRDDPWWHRKVKGLGETWIDRVTDALVALRSKYPVPAEPAEDVIEDLEEGEDE